jgi:Ca2+-binding RTX toxin-like protein
MSTINGTAGNDSLSGSDAADVINGLEGGDWLYGGKGNDTLTGGAGNDTLSGGDRTDTAVFSGNVADYSVAYNDGTYTIVDHVVGRDGLDQLVGLEVLQFANGTIAPASAVNDATIYGTSADDQRQGTSGPNVFDGLAGNDTIDGGAGTDTAIYAGSSAGYSVLYDSDTHVFSVTDSVQGRDGADTLTNVELLQFADGVESAATAAHITIIQGTSGADSLAGGIGADVLYGEDGNDTLSGGLGNDLLYGGNGTDTAVFAGNLADYTVTYYAGTGSYVVTDTVGGRDGTDRVVGVENFVFSDGTRAASQLLLVIVGTDGNDSLSGSPSADNISGLGGEDTLNGLAGDDTLAGGLGNDTLAGGDGNDLLIGEAGDNAIDGGAGSDTAVFAGSFAEYAVSYNGAASIYTLVDSVPSRDGLTQTTNVEFFQFADGLKAVGEAVNDTTIYGSPGADRVVGTDGADLIFGLAGADTLSGGAGSDTVSGGDGDDWVFSGDASPLFRNPYYDYVPPSPPLLDTGSAPDSIVGGNGQDTLFAGYGDSVDGGPGGDSLFVSFQGASSGVTADFRLLHTQPSITIGGGTITGIESIGWLEGSNFDDFLAPMDNGPFFYSDFEPIYGRGGNDHIIAGYYTGIVDGGDGNDLLDMSGTQYGFPAYGGAGDDTLIGGSNETLHGGEGNDVLYGPDWRADLFGDAGNDTLHGSNDGDRCYGGDGDDVLYAGNWRGNILDGAAGNDTLIGAAGNDSLVGGDGDDLLTAGAGGNAIDGGAGVDTAAFVGKLSEYWVAYNSSSATYTVIDSVHNREGADTVANVELLQFSDGTVAIADAVNNTDTFGTPGNDNLVGTSSADAINGLWGDDTIDGAAGDDVLTGWTGDDSLLGGIGNDSLDGGDGRDVLAGGGGSDTVVGGEGDDWIYSGAVSPAFSVPWNEFYAGVPPVLDTSGEADTLLGGAGDDNLFAGYGDSVDGGPHGSDGNALFISFQGATSGVVADFRLLYTQASIVIGGGTITNIQKIGWLEGSQFDDFLAPIDSPYSNFAPVYGLGGNDHIVAGDHTGLIDGGDGNDLLDGWLGDALPIHGGAGDDTLIGNGRYSSQLLDGGPGDDLIYVDWSGWVDGGTGTDTLVLAHDFADYTITYDSQSSSYDLVYGASLSVQGVEFFQFADGTKAASQLLPITGTSGNDLLTGTTGADAINGLDGNDTLNGAGGDDVLDGGNGNDILDGGDGNDTATYADASSGVTVSLASNSSQNTLGAGIDTLASIENLIGGHGNDALTGNALPNRLEGGPGNDTLTGGTGVDTMVGGFGNDNYFVDDAGDVVTENSGEGTDTVTSTVGYALGPNVENLILGGSAAIDGSGNELPNVITGNDAINVLTGNAGNDSLNGGGGNDFIQGSSGNDSIDGGTGSDTARFVGNFVDYSISYDQATNTLTVADSVDGRDGADRLVNVEFLQFADATVSTAPLIDIVGTPGNDLLTGTAGSELLDGMAGNDTLNGGAGDDTLIGGAGNDILNGGDGNDTASYAGSGLGVKVSLATTSGQNTVGAGTDTLTNIENLIGGSGNDVLTGNGLVNVLNGGAGDDILNGGVGADVMMGGAGNDGYFVDNAGDVVTENSGEGIDTVTSTLTYTLGANVESLVLGGTLAINGTGNELANIVTGNGAANVLTGNAGDDSLLGAAGNDILWGGDGNDMLNGGTGADQLHGGKGDDTYVVDSTLDQVFEDSGQGTDTVRSSVSFTLGADLENLLLLGSAAVGTGNSVNNAITGNASSNTLSGLGGNDVLDGLAGNDTLLGGDSNDTLAGGLGNDLMTGGAGQDVFVFNTAPGSRNIDRISDFTAVDDTIQLDSHVFTALPAGALDANALQVAATSAAAGAGIHIIFNTATGALLYDPDGAGGIAAVQFATIVLTGLTGPLTAADFVVT